MNRENDSFCSGKSGKSQGKCILQSSRNHGCTLSCYLTSSSVAGAQQLSLSSCTQFSYRSGETGSQGICVVREKSGKNIILQKSGKMVLEHADCRYLCFFVSLNNKKQANLWHPLNIQKLEVFLLQLPTRASVVCILHL